MNPDKQPAHIFVTDDLAEAVLREILFWQAETERRHKPAEGRTAIAVGYLWMVALTEKREVLAAIAFPEPLDEPKPGRKVMNPPCIVFETPKTAAEFEQVITEQYGIIGAGAVLDEDINTPSDKYPVLTPIYMMLKTGKR